MSWIAGARDALKARIESMGIDNLLLTAVWVPEIRRELLEKRELHVAPASQETTLAARGCITREAKIGVLLVDPLEQSKENEHAESAQLVYDQLIELLGERIGKSAGNPGYSVSAVAQPQILDASEWREHRKLSTTILVTLRQ